MASKTQHYLWGVYQQKNLMTVLHLMVCVEDKDSDSRTNRCWDILNECDDCELADAMVTKMTFICYYHCYFPGFQWALELTLSDTYESSDSIFLDILWTSLGHSSAVRSRTGFLTKGRRVQRGIILSLTLHWSVWLLNVDEFLPHRGQPSNIL